MLISIHLPKTAGTSFKKALEEHFGDTYMDDYGDNVYSLDFSEHIAKAVADSPVIAEKDFSGIECIHGHFLPLKYKGLAEKRDLQFITWMRDPVERLLSQYYFWLTYEPSESEVHHRKFLDEKWDLEKLCLHPKYRNMYSSYLHGFELEDLGFVGITEHYGEDIAYFSQKFLGTEIPVYEENRVKREMNRDTIDPELLRKIEEFHADDMDLYRRAVERRRRRVEGL